MHDWNWHNWGMPMMWFIWIPLIVLIIWLVVKQTKTDQSSGQKKEIVNGDIEKKICQWGNYHGRIRTAKESVRKRIKMQEIPPSAYNYAFIK